MITSSMTGASQWLTSLPMIGRSAASRPPQMRPDPPPRHRGRLPPPEVEAVPDADQRVVRLAPEEETVLERLEDVLNAGDPGPGELVELGRSARRPREMGTDPIPLAHHVRGAVLVDQLQHGVHVEDARIEETDGVAAPLLPVADE